MPKSEWLNYRDLAKRMGVKPETARRASDRAKLEKRRGNDGKQQVLIDLGDPRFDGSISRNRSQNRNTESEAKEEISALKGQLKNALDELENIKSALTFSEAIKAEKEAQIAALKDHIETLKDKPKRQWFWTR